MPSIANVYLVVWLTLLSSFPAFAQNWRPAGPPGGDVRSLSADRKDPQRLYLGTADGHIFGSADGAKHWQLLGRVGGPDDVVMAIVVDSRNSRTLYATAWSLDASGGGVFRSDDAGRNWRLIGLPGQSVRALAQAPSQPDTLVAGTLQGVFRSADSGKNWERISPAGHEDLRNFDSLAIDPRNPETIYAGTYHLPWKTTDAGHHWAPIHAGMIDDSDVMSMSIDHFDPQRIYASACSGIYRSENSGTLWTKFRGIPPTARRTHQLLQDPQRQRVLYSVTTEGLWKTENAGTAWSRITPADWSVAALLIHPTEPERLVIGVDGRGIFISDDGGKNFRAANDGFYHSQIMDLAYDPERPERMLLVLTNAAEPVLATQDGGRSWTRLGSSLKTHLLRGIYAAPDGWWAALEGGGWMRYEAKQNAWVKVGIPAGKPALQRSVRKATAKTASLLTPVVNDMAFSSKLWLAATDAGLLASRDRGATWTAMAMGSPTKLPVNAVRVSADGSGIWALSAGALAISTDAGKTWISRAIDFPARGKVRLHQADDATLFIASSSRLYVSRDAGKSWRPSTLRELDICDVAARDYVVLVSTQKKGLHVSYNGGETWTHVDSPVAEGYFPVVAAGATARAFLAASSTEGLYALDLPAGAVASAKAQAGRLVSSPH